MKRFDVDEDPGKSGESDQQPAPGEETRKEPWPGFDPRNLPQVEWPFPPIPPRVQQAVSVVIREALEAGLTLQQTYDRVLVVLAGHNLFLSHDDLSGWVGSHALAVS